ncbi:MAG: hypothetical protein HYU29_01360 [Chloroflexi bacterium]|nr:hypothetical protein [Chloroflexota bacterium]
MRYRTRLNRRRRRRLGRRIRDELRSLRPPWWSVAALALLALAFAIGRILI